MQKQNRKSGCAKKYGRNKKGVDQTTSNYVLGKITFEQYAKNKNLKIKSR